MDGVAQQDGQNLPFQGVYVSIARGIHDDSRNNRVEYIMLRRKLRT